MNKTRTIVNLVTFLLLSVLLVAMGLRNFVLVQSSGPTLLADLEDASGLSIRNDVTMRGVVVGSITDVELRSPNVRIEMTLEPGTEVPGGTKALVVRRSPIGELTVELEPGLGAPLGDGGVISISDTVPPPDVSSTIEAFASFLHAVPSEDLNTVVSELADAVRGRADDIAKFTDASLKLPERLLEVSDELESLIRNGPKVTGVFADNAEVLADDITQIQLLADILRDRRFDLVELNANGARFLEVAGDLLSDEKANLSCFIRDSGKTNSALVNRRNDLIRTLDDNHFFFDGVRSAVKKDNEGGTWFRVQLLPHQEPAGATYDEHRPIPDVLLGRACNTRYGAGVAAAKGNAILPSVSRLIK